MMELPVVTPENLVISRSLMQAMEEHCKALYAEEEDFPITLALNRYQIKYRVRVANHEEVELFLFAFRLLVGSVELAVASGTYPKPPKSKPGKSIGDWMRPLGR